MDDAQLLRYSRHILLYELGVEGQQRLLDSHALILGAGGLGSPVAMYLAASGVGRLTLIDDDEVDLTNLQRQIAHTTARVGQPKVTSAREALLALNPLVRVDTVQARADEASLMQLVADADVVIDVREADEFAAGHVPGAVHASRGMLEFKLSASPELSRRDLKVVLYCKTSGRAALAAAAMKDMGYLNVTSMAGGFDAWVAAGKPVAQPRQPSFE